MGKKGGPSLPIRKTDGKGAEEEEEGGAGNGSRRRGRSVTKTRTRPAARPISSPTEVASRGGGKVEFILANKTISNKLSYYIPDIFCF